MAAACWAAIFAAYCGSLGSIASPGATATGEAAADADGRAAVLGEAGAADGLCVARAEGCCVGLGGA